MENTSHNPDQHMFGFRQLATNGRKRIGILLGAGAPVSINVGEAGTWKPLIPNIAGLEKIVLDELSGSQREVFNQIKSSFLDSNLEKVLSRVRMLAEVIGDGKLFGFTEKDFSGLSEAICNSIREVVAQDLPLGTNPYSELVSWINGISRRYAIEIFTTNYDLLIENALERARTPYFDGFSGSKSAFFDPSSISKNDLPPRWVRLWKLHGSIGWESNANGEVVRVPNSKNANMVYPSHIKYDQTQAAPFSSLFDRLKNFILEPDTLILSTGFSFADAHISSRLLECLMANPTAALFAFQFNGLADEKAAKELALKCPGISVFCSDGAVINGIEAKWKIGTPPTKNWHEIRAEYYKDNKFLLGDFLRLARFLATAGSDISQDAAPPVPQEVQEGVI
ncbi:SIR2 family protein [Pseudomonas chlororaphis]|uniref:SIR2 family protein n=1 Tax=Pseudomonas chlororaphis TaxID=587753 RepID=UPI001B303226|nr:SIR2 family protein [Pseudomonas chlororaphis]QTT89314.1 SIR2 family protein [Pseudomonas chlororaphis]